MIAASLVLAVTVPVPARAQRPPASPVVAIHQLTLGNVFLSTEQPAVRVTAVGQDFAYSVVDFWGSTVEAGVQPLIGGIGDVTLTLHPGASGYFIVHVSARVAGLPVAEAQAALAVLPPDPSPSDVLAASPFSVQTHMRDNTTDQRMVTLIDKLGVRKVRDYMLWEKVETQAGTYTYPPSFTGQMANFAQHGISPLLTLCYANPSYDGGNAPTSPEGISAFVRYAEDQVRRFGSQTQTFEVFNEWNLFATGPANGTPGSYFNLLKATTPALRAIRPDLTILGGSTSTVGLSAEPDYAWIEELFRLGGLGYLDVLSAHVYTQPLRPEGETTGQSARLSAKEQVAKLDSLVRRYNGGASKPIWVTETGWGTGLGDPAAGPVNFNTAGGTTPLEADQAAYAVRNATLMLSAGAERISWYMFHDLFPGSARSLGGDYGLVRWGNQDWDDAPALLLPDDPLGNYTPKPSYVAYATMVRELSGATFGTASTSPSGVIDHRYGRSGTEVHVVWSPGGGQLYRLPAAANVTLVDIMGRRSQVVPDADGTVPVQASAYPVYVEIPPIVTATTTKHGDKKKPR